MDPRQVVGLNVLRLRLQQGMSQTGLAAKLGPRNLGVTQGYVSELESGGKNPTLLTLAALADALSVPLSALFERPRQSEAAVKSGPPSC